MIKIKYECDETGQEMEIIFTIPEDENKDVEARVEWKPTATRETKDPLKIMGKLVKLVIGMANKKQGGQVESQ